MLKLYRSNRAEFLAQLLAQQLLEQGPGPLETVEVMVNTWPTSRWLGEQLALANGISSLVRFPFPGSRLRQLVRQVLELPAEQNDPWRAGHLVWAVLDGLPEVLDEPSAEPLRQWLACRDGHRTASVLSRDRWQLARSIADAFDDYALYRPAMLQQWRGDPAPADWQPLLWRALDDRLSIDPFGLQVHAAVQRLLKGEVQPTSLPDRIRLFGISALAPVQVELIQALSGLMEVEIYLLTPCPDLWQRCGSRRQQLGEDWLAPPDGDWLEEAPRLEGILGRMGAEFQQLLEGVGEVQLGERQEGDLFAAPVAMAQADERPPALLEQLQQQLVDSHAPAALQREGHDQSLLFQSAPGPWREVQLVRDRILQWLADDPELEPRDVLVMTPQIDRYAPLLGSVFNDVAAIGVDLPWRLTDRTQQSSPGLSMAMFALLELAAGRFTATALQQWLSNPAVQRQQALPPEDAVLLTRTLQRSGFRWGLDSSERGGDETHSLRWCLDRWLLGLVLPEQPGLAPGGAAPFHQDLDPERLARWWTLLNRLACMIEQLRRPRTSAAWSSLLLVQLQELFGDGGPWSGERQSWCEALEDWRRRAESCSLKLDVGVALEVLQEALSIDSGRFGHRSGSLTVSALEPMRAIPHQVIVLMGLDGAEFPRPSRRSGFHLLEQERRLGDPRSSDQDRYALLEALMSARKHLLISWCGRQERTGEDQPPAAPVEQWLTQLQQELCSQGASTEGLLVTPAPNPLARSNFDPEQPLSCDRRQLEARRWLDQKRPEPSSGLAWPRLMTGPYPTAAHDASGSIDADVLLGWLQRPQATWLRQRGLRPGEGIDPVTDLDPLELEGLQRYQLLDQAVDLDPLDERAPDWLSVLAGQGVLPAGSGAEFEQRQLEERWQALVRQLHGLGPCRRELRSLGGISRRVLFAGDVQVVLQAGQLTAAGTMQGWLQHLLLCAADEAPAGGSAVLARSNRVAGASVHLRWRSLNATDAQDVLNTLEALASKGMQRCWPVPPKSGWQLVWKEHLKTGTGIAGFKSIWNDERQTPAMQLCFGVEAEAERLLETSGFTEACTALYGPLLQHLHPATAR